MKEKKCERVSALAAIVVVIFAIPPQTQTLALAIITFIYPQREHAVVC